MIKRYKILAFFMLPFFLLSFFFFCYFETLNLKNASITLGQLIEKALNDNQLKKDTIDTGYNQEQASSSKYYFYGRNPDNYLIFQNYCFRIMSITQNDNLKVIYEGKAENNACHSVKEDTYLSGTVGLLTFNGNESNYTNDWFDNNLERNGLKIQLETFIKENNINGKVKIDFSDPNIATGDWFVGKIEDEKNLSLIEIIDQERNSNSGIVWKSKLGTYTISEYMKVGCPNATLNEVGIDCTYDNYLFRMGTSYIYTLTSPLSNNQNTSCIYLGKPLFSCIVYYQHAFRPVLFLKKSNRIYGEGTIDKPYYFK